jgi:hypothetical protein
MLEKSESFNGVLGKKREKKKKKAPLLTYSAALAARFLAYRSSVPF